MVVDSSKEKGVSHFTEATRPQNINIIAEERAWGNAEIRGTLCGGLWHLSEISPETEPLLGWALKENERKCHSKYKSIPLQIPPGIFEVIRNMSVAFLSA